jgi:hypothetical protein
MLLGPGVDESNVVLRVVVILSGVIGVQTLAGIVGGSSSYKVWTGCGCSRKKCCWKICALCIGLLTSVLSVLWRGGNMLVGRPFQTFVSDYMS